MNGCKPKTDILLPAREDFVEAFVRQAPEDRSEDQAEKLFDLLADGPEDARTSILEWATRYMPQYTLAGHA
jgi:hypothetical protein